MYLISLFQYHFTASMPRGPMSQDPAPLAKPEGIEISDTYGTVRVSLNCQFDTSDKDFVSFHTFRAKSCKFLKILIQTKTSSYTFSS